MSGYNSTATNIQMDRKEFQKIMFIYKAIEDGWKVNKNADSDAYIFTKKHENRREIFQTDYLEKFILKNSILK